jgi:hypothetical protein
MVACGKGVSLVTLAHKDSTPDFMPVDLSIKAMILAAYHRGTHKYLYIYTYLLLIAQHKMSNSRGIPR